MKAVPRMKPVMKSRLYPLPMPIIKKRTIRQNGKISLSKALSDEKTIKIDQIRKKQKPITPSSERILRYKLWAEDPFNKLFSIIIIPTPKFPKYIGSFPKPTPTSRLLRKTAMVASHIINLADEYSLSSSMEFKSIVNKSVYLDNNV